ncbi:MAG: hypothetical protein WC807_17840 [Hyphomicrobium sp.]|jgi:hypothetical protein
MMTAGNPRPITLTLSDQHIEQMIKHHDLTEADAVDMAKVAKIAQRLFDEALGLPEPLWREWDDWAKGLE